MRQPTHAIMSLQCQHACYCLAHFALVIISICNIADTYDTKQNRQPLMADGLPILIQPSEHVKIYLQPGCRFYATFIQNITLAQLQQQFKVN